MGAILSLIGAIATSIVAGARRAASWCAKTADAVARWARRRPRAAVFIALAAFAFYSAALVAAGVAGGVWAQNRDFPERIQSRLGRILFKARLRAGDDAQRVEWRRVESLLHTLEVARVRIRTERARGGAIVEVAGHIVFASPHGRLGYLSAQNRLAPIALSVPMGLDALRASPLRDDPLFVFEEVRTYDLFVRPSGAGRYHLYASHSRFVRENCFQFVVSRAELVATGDAVRAAGPDWRTVFIARPSCIPYKDRSWRFVGSEAGGRIVELDEATLLISIGDHQFDGFNDAYAAAMDPETDLGKIIALDLASGRSRIYAMGVRNPQGLYVTPAGDVWETEHGPLAGDEINFIREGGNYGWPHVTYGVNYGFPRRPWPFNTRPGRHEGYVQPALSFAPSIAISNLTAPSAAEFPEWEGDLLVASLRAEALYRMRPQADRIVYAEPLALDRARLRDIISMRDGRIVILTDSGWLMFVRNAERHAREPRSFTVTGLAALGAPNPEENLPAVDEVGRGRRIFASLCASCHSLSGDTGPGPPLNGVVGRPVGAMDFGYSAALADYDGVWTEDLLISFLTEPDRRFRGAAMPDTHIPWLEAPRVAAFLKSTRGSFPRAPERVPERAPVRAEPR